MSSFSSTKSFISGVVGSVIAVVVNMHPVLHAFVLLAALDFGTGWAKAFLTGTVSSDASMKGTTKKAVMFMVIATAWVIQHKLGADLPMVELDIATAGFFCATEIFSILENAKACGVPVPDFLMDRFKQKETK